MTQPRSQTQERAVSRRIVVIVGTDHHPFNRLITWTTEWLRLCPVQADGCFVQWGAASVRPICAGSRFLDVAELAARLDAADVIICHGGPATIAEAWSRGRLPIVVPRLARLGEHVDDHQVDFCKKMADLGRIALVQTLSDFTRLLDEAVADPFVMRATSSSPHADLAVARLGALVEELTARPRQVHLIGRGRRLRRDPGARLAGTVNEEHV